MFPIGAAIGGAMSLYQIFDGKNRLDKMGERPNIEIEQGTTDWMNRMKGRADYGLSRDQTSGMWNDVNRGENTAYNRAMNTMGNTGAGAMMAALNSNNINARLNIGRMDAQAKDQHVREAGPWVQYFQGLRNQQQQNKMQNWDREAQSYGNEAKAGMENLMGVGNDIDSVLDMNRSHNLLKGFLGMGKKPKSDGWDWPASNTPTT
jgi:hypothetical protein